MTLEKGDNISFDTASTIWERVATNLPNQKRYTTCQFPVEEGTYFSQDHRTILQECFILCIRFNLSEACFLNLARS